MAVLGQIRQRSVFLILVIGMALFAFVISGVFDGNTSNSPPSDPIAIVNDEEIAKLHELWLGIPGPTDVLSFDLSCPERSQHMLHKHCDSVHGEIIASAETASREALLYHWSPDYELTYYFLHGLLHLNGYNDQTPSERTSMRRKERSLMKAIGLPSPPRRRPKTTPVQR